MKTSLYCYFGLLGNNVKLDIPGHNFYQLPLIDSLKERYQFNKVDFYSYIPEELQKDGVNYPTDSELGLLFADLYQDNIDNYCVPFNDILLNISNKVYDKLFLKARFRNISTLKKKWTDAFEFESIIQEALNSGYNPNDIIIIDTDLSMPPHFLEWLELNKVIRIIPSIDFSPITKSFAEKLIKVHSNRNTFDRAFYYGNLDFKNYKPGHEKDDIVHDCINSIKNTDHFGLGYEFKYTSKENSDYTIINRTERDCIWDYFISTKLCLNVSKDLYTKVNFIPARVYEAVIFGAIPVSYKMPYIVDYLSFENIEQLEEIKLFLLEMNQVEYSSFYERFVRDFILNK